MPHLDKEPQPFFESQKSSHSKKEMASKMYSTSRCGKCNRFGHSHDKCATGKKLESKLDSFIARNKDAGKQTKYLD